MTDTISTEGIDTTAAPVAGELAHIDPNQLDIGENVREYANLSKPFLDSIAEHGVLVPLTGIRRPDGIVQIRNGQRRCAAARKVGLPTVPVYVLPAAHLDSSAETIDRIVHQIVTNDHKADLTDAQRARGIQQMIDAGMSVTKVARKLSITKDTVTAAETAAKSSTALEALSAGQLSLTEAAAITEFDTDAQAVARLLDAAGGASFDHVVAQLRTERVSAAARAEAEADYTARGFTVLAERRWGWNLDCVPLAHLQTPAEQDADAEMITDPQFWAVWLEEYADYIDTATGEPVNEDDVDWDTENLPDEQPAEGLRHADTVTERPSYQPEWFCLDPEAAGVAPTDMFRRNAEWSAGRQRSQDHGGTDAGSASQDPDADTEADREAARLRAEAERSEADKRARRMVLALNKLGAAAITVRREFVSTLLARKTLPKGAAVFIADCLARDTYLLTHHTADTTAAELLGVEAGSGTRTLIAELPTGSGDGRAAVITLALVLGALETRTGKDAWRNVRMSGDGAPSHWSPALTSREYLQFLAANGYTLSAVEEIITGVRSADEVHDEYAAAKTAQSEQD
ncbi:ParB N-terminal domain-containing protein [Mycobacterium sp. 155]|uniref:ParB/RepB/Spo0J family partition protein n=1 Tax=Mycobacterium sp. 155 TaxID=1157943 RepID=UPI000362A662|nr:ParB N-terminal domain-containing protein [Mycobacterium sp. 155]